MNLPSARELDRGQLAAIERYYRIHARIYDLTRWTFLRGREALIKQVAARLTPNRILEVGCGTGTNLLHLGNSFPRAHLWGLDLSADMLAVARKKLRNVTQRLTLVKAAYDQPLAAATKFDLVVFSYALSMFGPGYEEAIMAARLDLTPHGAIAVVDFHDSVSQGFKKWMGLNHVRLDGHLLPGLKSLFRSHKWAVRPAYGGIWSYFFFFGHNP
jgi:S-adenosylmethionine-diacylgycerolhomoserine-N-methlytransferase